MTRLFKLLGLRGRPTRPESLAEAADTEPGFNSGWHESSMELRRGLTVLEQDELDAGPETRPFTYQVDAA
jgi:hypothetical protein